MTDALQQASHAMAEQMYKQKESAPGSTPKDAPNVHDGEVIDAEVVDA
jgi:hypothetical protein